MDLRDGSAYWATRDGIGEVFPPLTPERGRRVTADVVVVGAGITGALAALELVDRGLDVVVVDRRDVATGSTAASTSMLQYEIDELLVDLADAIGWEQASAAYRECARGIELVERATQRVGELCGFRRSPSVYVAPTRRSAATLRRELDARRAAGFDVDWVEPDELRDTWGIAGEGAIVSQLGGSVDPYRLAHASLAEVVARGGSVYDRSGMTALETTVRRVRVETERGVTVTATWAVIATGYEVERLLPDLPISLHSSFAFVSEPVPGIVDRYPQGMLFWDHADPYLYGRTTDDGRVLVGGADEPHNDPLRRRRSMTAKVARLQRDVARRVPALDLEVGYAWAGTFAETPDGLAYIGEHPSLPRTQFALGFGGNGITYSAVAAKYIAAAITRDGSEPHAELFRVDRAPAEM